MSDPHEWDFRSYTGKTHMGGPCVCVDAMSDGYPREFTGRGATIEEALKDAAEKVEAYLAEIEDDEPQPWEQVSSYARRAR